VCDILSAYCTMIRSVLEHACPVWHPDLTKKFSRSFGLQVWFDYAEHIQRNQRRSKAPTSL